MHYPESRVSKIKRLIETKGEEWLISAMVEGSVGYHSYNSAKRMIDRVLQGKFTLCERTSACFSGDASMEILHDAECFEWLEQYNKDKVERIVEFVKKTKNLDPIQQVTIGLMYPTVGI